MTTSEVLSTLGRHIICVLQAHVFSVSICFSGHYCVVPRRREWTVRVRTHVILEHSFRPLARPSIPRTPCAVYHAQCMHGRRPKSFICSFFGLGLFGYFLRAIFSTYYLMGQHWHLAPALSRHHQAWPF